LNSGDSSNLKSKINVTESISEVLETLDSQTAAKLKTLLNIQKQNIANSVLLLKNKLSKTEAELKAAKEKSEVTNAMKEEFLATISHELRTPLNTIILLVELMEMDDKEKVFEESLEKIRNSSRSLIQIINDMLDITKSDAGKITVNQKQFDLSELLKTTCEIFSNRAEQRGLEFEYKIYNDVHVDVLSDSARIRQILINLIGNAIKFTESGSVNLRIYAKETYSDHQVVIFEVKDTGIGIESEENDDLFDHFTQADSSATRKYGGTGLGLAICKRLVELMDGKIYYESIHGKGSTFNFELPLLRPVLISEADNLSIKKGSINSVLLVDDDEDMLMLTEKILLKSNYKVITAVNGHNALIESDHEKFNLIFMDCRMPGMDGFECAKAIRANPNNKNYQTPIIALTANVLKEDIKKCKDVGMNGFLAKPIEKAELLDILKKYSSK